MWSCKHCTKVFNFTSTSQKANHTRWCDSNPNRNNTKNLIKSQQKYFNNKLGEIKHFNVSCNTCKNIFQVQEREKQFPSKEKYFCSSSCSNFRGSGITWSNTMNKELQNYRTICFAYHQKQCVICDESLILEVHHLDENHLNNTPSNLIPLCPTHHQYWHSSHIDMIKNKILSYQREFILWWNQRESNSPDRFLAKDSRLPRADPNFKI